MKIRDRFTSESLAEYFCEIRKENKKISVNYLLQKIDEAEKINNDDIGIDAAVLCRGKEYSEFMEFLAKNYPKLWKKNTEGPKELEYIQDIAVRYKDSVWDFILENQSDTAEYLDWYKAFIDDVYDKFDNEVVCLPMLRSRGSQIGKVSFCRRVNNRHDLLDFFKVYRTIPSTLIIHFYKGKDEYIYGFIRSVSGGASSIPVGWLENGERYFQILKTDGYNINCCEYNEPFHCRRHSALS